MKSIKINYSFLLILFICLYFLYFIFFNNDIIEKETLKYDLIEDGFCILKNVFPVNKILYLKELSENKNYKQLKLNIIEDENLKKNIFKKIKISNYKFHDYIFIIQKSSVHTCHRDYNGDFFNSGQKYPSYTMIIYLEDMEKCLGVIPKSHMNINSYSINFTNKVKNLACNKGDIIIFNSNLIHVGTINKKNDNLRIQMKISHKDDINTLSYYQNYNKILKEDNLLPKFLRQAQMNISCMFPFFANLNQKEDIKSLKNSHNKKDSIIKKIFTFMFYGKTNFYDLPNAY